MIEKSDPNVIDDLDSSQGESYTNAFKKRIFKASKEIEKNLIRGQAIPLPFNKSEEENN